MRVAELIIKSFAANRLTLLVPVPGCDRYSLLLLGAYFQV